MSRGAVDGYQVTLTYEGMPVEITSPVFEDWDDDETQVRISFYEKIPDAL